MHAVVGMVMARRHRRTVRKRPAGQRHDGQAGEVLQTQYGIAAEHLEFFDRFAEDAEEDLGWEESTLVEWAFTTERQLTAARAFRYRLDIDYQYVQPVHAAITTGELPVQVPVSLYEEEPPSL